MNLEFVHIYNYSNKLIKNKRNILNSVHSGFIESVKEDGKKSLVLGGKGRGKSFVQGE